jgi:ParB family chromosome partitioning protein
MTSSTIQHVPLSRLVTSAHNVRRTGAAADIPGLAANIKAIGLLQCLDVLPARDDGTVEVIAGHRRLAALKLLRDAGDVAADAPIAVCVLDPSVAAEASLAENTLRVAMHPADQFDAFRKLVDEGRSVDEVAARFGTTAMHVEQRLRLSRCSASLVQVYRDGGMTLEQLQAYACTNDTKAQESHWKRTARTTWEREPRNIREALTKGEIDATLDDRARFVGVAAYEAAGGKVRRDLFGGPNAGFLTDAALLDRLVAEKLEAAAEQLREQGFVEVRIVAPDFYCGSHGFQELYDAKPQHTPEQAKRLAAVEAELRDLGEKDVNGPAEAADVEELEERLDAERETILATARYPAAVTKRAHAFVSLQRGGALRLSIAVPAKDRKQTAPATPTKDGKPVAKPIGETLQRRLGCHLTAALRTGLVEQPKVAARLLAHTLALSTFYPHEHERSSATIRATHNDLKLTDSAISDAATWQRFEARRKEWTSALPKKPSELWAWVLSQDDATLGALIAFAVANNVSAVQVPLMHQASSPALAANDLVDALALDMRLHWRPTRELYLDALSKAQVLATLKEAGIARPEIERLAPLKSGEVQAEAERLLAGTDWMPKALRTKAAAAKPAADKAPAAGKAKPAAKGKAGAKAKAAAPRKAAAKPKARR